MPLADYGVAIGTYVSFYRDPPHAMGTWYHGHLQIMTPAGQYTSALDVDKPSGGVSVKTMAPLDPALFSAVSALPDGWHPLASTPTSGALDYVRSELLLDRCPPPSWVRPFPSGTPWYRRVVLWPYWFRHLICLLFRKFRHWTVSTGDNALDILVAALAGCHRVYIFGQHYQDGGLGVHDVHMNQGDPSGTQWWAENGTWQDGGVVVEKADGTLAAWLVRFNTQSLDTDANGHPV
jgi:hypothetical protein